MAFGSAKKAITRVHPLLPELPPTYKGQVDWSNNVKPTTKPYIEPTIQPVDNNNNIFHTLPFRPNKLQSVLFGKV